MAVVYDKTNGIVTCDAVSDEVNEELDVEYILLAGTAAGHSTIQDSLGNTLADLYLTAACLSFYFPLQRKVNGIKVTALGANTYFAAYLRKF